MPSCDHVNNLKNAKVCWESVTLNLRVSSLETTVEQFGFHNFLEHEDRLQSWTTLWKARVKMPFMQIVPFCERSISLRYRYFWKESQIQSITLWGTACARHLCEPCQTLSRWDGGGGSCVDCAQIHDQFGTELENASASRTQHMLTCVPAVDSTRRARGRLCQLCLVPFSQCLSIHLYNWATRRAPGAFFKWPSVFR